MTISFSLLLDLIIASLLFVTILYSYTLSKKIKLLHQGRHDLKDFVKSFNVAIDRAEKNIDTLKEMGGEADDLLRHNIEKARFLANDLSFLMNKGENVADKLEQHITLSRSLEGNKNYAKNVQSSLSAMANSRPKPPAQNPERRKQEYPAAQSSESKYAEARQKGRKKQQQNSSQEMTPSKKQALDTALAQIASRRAGAKKSDPSPSVSKDETESTQKSGRDIFDDRKLAESLSRITE